MTNKLMSLFEKSPLELICLPLKLAGLDDVRQAHIYEHVFTPIVLMSYFSFFHFKIKLCVFILIFLWHFIWKECLYDTFIANKDLNLHDWCERIYGLCLASLFLFN
jgi:hypothetical protein